MSTEVRYTQTVYQHDHHLTLIPFLGRCRLLYLYPGTLLMSPSYAYKIVDPKRKLGVSYTNLRAPTDTMSGARNYLAKLFVCVAKP